MKKLKKDVSSHPENGGLVLSQTKSISKKWAKHGTHNSDPHHMSNQITELFVHSTIAETTEK